MTTRPATFTESFAKDRLARLERCQRLGIKPVRPGDEGYICLTDQIALIGQPLRHDEEEIRLLQVMAGWRDHDPPPPRMPQR